MLQRNRFSLVLAKKKNYPLYGTITSAEQVDRLHCNIYLNYVPKPESMQNSSSNDQTVMVDIWQGLLAKESGQSPIMDVAYPPYITQIHTMDH